MTYMYTVLLYLLLLYFLHYNFLMYGNYKFFFHISLPFDIIPGEEADEVWNIFVL